MSLKDIKGELALHLRLDRYLYADAAKERDTLINLVSKAVGVHEPVKEELKDFIKESYDYKTSYTTSRPPLHQLQHAGEIKALTIESRNELIRRLGGDKAVKRGIEIGMRGGDEALKEDIDIYRQLRLYKNLRKLQKRSRNELTTLTKTNPPHGPNMTGPSARLLPKDYVTAASLILNISSLPAIISLGDLGTSEKAIDECISKAKTYINYVKGRSVSPPGLPDKSRAQINNTAETAAGAPPHIKAGSLPKPH